MDTLSEFCVRLRLETQVGCSPSALRGVMQALEAAVSETAQTWEQDGIAPGAVREVIGGVDETFLQRMMLVFQDWATGYLLWEDVADNRTFATGYAVVEARLTALGTTVFAMVSDRANALIQLAEQGLECLSMPDVFHVVHEIVKSSSLARGQRWRAAQQERRQAKTALARLQGSAHAEHATREAQALVEARQAEVTRWEAVHHTYRGYLETRSLTLHPFRLMDSTPQTSAQVDSQRTAAVEALVALTQRAQLPARPKALTKIRKHLPALAALVDVWWQGVHQDLAPLSLSPQWQQWVGECLLPMVYWATQGPRTRCRRRKARLHWGAHGSSNPWATTTSTANRFSPTVSNITRTCSRS
ncbi:MAG: hypothetical protein AB7N91_15455 [Candidatus Tectimicrobiota bacterium]